MRSAAQWPRTETVWRQFAQLDLVLERLDIDPVLAARRSGGMAMASARDTCRACLSPRECARRLERTGDARAILDFCPNAEFLIGCIRPRG